MTRGSESLVADLHSQVQGLQVVSVRRPPRHYARKLNSGFDLFIISYHRTLRPTGPSVVIDPGDRSWSDRDMEKQQECLHSA